MSNTRSRLAGGVASTLLAVVLAATFAPTASEARSDEALSAEVTNASGDRLGIVRFGDDDGKLVVKAKLAGLSPGFHGFHVHTKGTCDPRAVDTAGNLSPFFTAGGHYNPRGTNHGAHAGDMPPLLVASDGSAVLRFTTDRLTAGELLDADGSAVIVHAGPDNLAHVPGTSPTGERYHSHLENVFGPDSATRATGDAGARAGCGVIEGTND